MTDRSDISPAAQGASPPAWLLEGIRRGRPIAELGKQLLVERAAAATARPTSDPAAASHPTPECPLVTDTPTPAPILQAIETERQRVRRVQLEARRAAANREGRA